MKCIARLGAALSIAVSAVSMAAPPTIGGCPVFPANNYWNTPIDTLPRHASSNAWVASIGNTARLHADWGNNLADNYGIPFITVTAAQPLLPIYNYTVGDPYDNYGDESDPGPYPIPQSAPIEGGGVAEGDRHVLVVETTNCVLYELYNARVFADGWKASSYVKFPLSSNALRPAGWTSADAAGLPVFPGLVRWEEAASGEINHAIRFTAANIWGRENGQAKYLWPARHWSGSSTASTRPPMGARFRLKASYQIPASFHPTTQTILRAFKKYGLVLADAGSNWFFQGVSNANWDGRVFSELGGIAGSNFEAVDAELLQVNVSSAEATLAADYDPPRLAHLSTRGDVQAGADVLIAGFAIEGARPKTVIVRAIGPSLAAQGVSGALANPQLQLLRFPDNVLIGANDDWAAAANAAHVTASGLAPGHAQESAILVTLPPGTYTAVVSGAGGTTGVGLVEVYEIDRPIYPSVALSTRGRVMTGDGVMIGGFIILGSAPQTVLVRGIGPSLQAQGVAGALQNPALQLVRMADQAIIASNDDWQDSASAGFLAANGLAPTNARESAVLMTLQPGAYTAILSGSGGATGVGLVEVYKQ